MSDQGPPGAPGPGARAPRARPLTVADTPGDEVVDTTAVTARHGRLPSVLLALGVAVGVGVAAVAIAFSVIAVPLYALASTEPGSGLDRSMVRRGLFGVAIPFGVVAGVVVGAVVGAWYARGGRLPGDRTSIHEQG
jgi:ABC-type dipeptide/oligopeptide/nickel transport system permease component